MTNDTSTLNGALQELGETMAANLTTQGVTASASDGLMTLASKILDISPSPTPTPASMTLTSTKSILSYYDSEYAVLTATVYDSSSNPLSGQTVTMKVYNSSDTLLDTLTVTDNSDGTYTASYYAEGTGDLYVKAECVNVSEIYSIEDCVIYKTTPISITGTSTSDTVYSVGIDDLGYDLSSKNFDLDFILKFTSYGEQFNIGAKSEWSVSPIKGNYRAYIGCTGGGKKAYGIRTTSTNGSEVGNAGSFTQNTDHTCKISKSSSTFTYIVDGDTLGTKTENWWSNYSNWSFYIVQWNNGTTTISNLKLKVTS